MAKKARSRPGNDEGEESQELMRKLLAVSLYQAGASYDVIARMTGKRKHWVVATLKGLPDRRRQ